MSYEKFYPGGWQSGESGGTPITPEALNHIENGINQTYSDFAPAGYGWGEGRPASQFTANNVNRTAVFVSAGEDMPTNDSAWLCEFYATSSDGSGNYGHMVATCQGGIAKGCICYRLRENGVYGEWEWVNPPMVPGVEYRTTERYWGSAVYAKLVDFGYLPNNSAASVPITGDGVAYPVRGYLLIGGSNIGQGTAIGNQYPYVDEFYTGADNITIRTNTDMSGTRARVEIYYTKD